MDVFTNTKKSKKIFIVLILLILFNFGCPKVVRAGDVGNWMWIGIGSIFFGLFNGIQEFIDNVFIDDEIKKTFGGDVNDTRINGFGGEDAVIVSAENVIKGKFLLMDPNIFKDVSAGIGEYLDYNKVESGRNSLRETISGWYYALRNLAIVALLSILVYVAIRMILSTVSQDKAKYKVMFKDWLVALCLLFLIHYIMVGILNLSSTITTAIGNSGQSYTSNLAENIDSTIEYCADLTERPGTSDEEDEEVKEKMTDALANTVIYAAMVIMNIIFIAKYVIRALTIIFLILLAPITCITYPIDKISDGKAQAYDMWFKEFLYQVIIQPFHLLIYVVLIGSAAQLAADNLIYAMLCFGVMIPAEKFIKQMFGFKDKLGSPLGAFAGGAVANQLMNSLKSVGKGGSGGKDNDSGKTDDLPPNTKTVDLPGTDGSVNDGPDGGNSGEPVGDDPVHPIEPEDDPVFPIDDGTPIDEMPTDNNDDIVETYSEGTISSTSDDTELGIIDNTSTTSAETEGTETTTPREVDTDEDETYSEGTISSTSDDTELGTIDNTSTTSTETEGTVITTTPREVDTDEDETYSEGTITTTYYTDQDEEQALPQQQPQHIEENQEEDQEEDVVEEDIPEPQTQPQPRLQPQHENNEEVKKPGRWERAYRAVNSRASQNYLRKYGTTKIKGKDGIAAGMAKRGLNKAYKGSKNVGRKAIKGAATLAGAAALGAFGAMFGQGKEMALVGAGLGAKLGGTVTNTTDKIVGTVEGYVGDAHNAFWDNAEQKDKEKFKENRNNIRLARQNYRDRHDGIEPKGDALNQELENMYIMDSHGINKNQYNDVLSEYEDYIKPIEDGGEGLDKEEAMNTAMSSALQAQIYSAKDFRDEKAMKQAYDELYKQYEGYINNGKISKEKADENIRRILTGGANMKGVKNPPLPPIKQEEVTETIDIPVNREIPELAGALGISEPEMTEERVQTMTNLRIRLVDAGYTDEQIRQIAELSSDSRVSPDRVMTIFEDNVNASVEYLNNTTARHEAQRLVRSVNAEVGGKAPKTQVDAEMRDRFILKSTFNVEKEKDVSAIRDTETEVFKPTEKTQVQAAREFAIANRGRMNDTTHMENQKERLRIKLRTGAQGTVSEEKIQRDVENIARLAEIYTNE